MKRINLNPGETVEIVANGEHQGDYVMPDLWQRDPRWGNLRYNGGRTLSGAGCLIMSVLMKAKLHGYDVDVKRDVVNMRDAGCFYGDDLQNPQNVKNVLPLEWVKRISFRDTLASVDDLQESLSLYGPTVAEVDFVPGGQFNQHFVLLLKYIPGELDDAIVFDPWHGAQVSARIYARPEWSSFPSMMARVFTGLRVWKYV